MNISLGPEILQSYKRLSYKVWYAFAEFIDNSTQAYFIHKKVLDKQLKAEANLLTVEIGITNDYIAISDNSIGMTHDELEAAFRIGIPPADTSGRSKYGLGMKTAAFWFGDEWTVITKKLGEPQGVSVTISLGEIIDRIHKKEQGEKIEILEPKLFDELVSAHYTKIRITKLNRRITERNLVRTKEYLSSIFRNDIVHNNLVLKINNERLSWLKDDFKKRLLCDEDGIPYYENFSFEINGKEVSGWAGVLKKGSKKDAGFSLLQAGRVIEGWPDGYRTKLLFGDQEGGTNTLTNQRLVGEINLDGFNVSHTKDEILFEEDEEDILDEKLYEKLIGLKRIAETYRKDESNLILKIDLRNIIEDVFEELNSDTFINSINHDVLPQKVIELSNKEVIDRAIEKETKDIYETEIAGIKIIVIINNNGSIYDPYLVNRYKSRDSKELTIVVNRNHPYINEYNSKAEIIQFIKECVLDGLSEWKAFWMTNTLEPETIRQIKDGYMRHKFKLR